MFIREVHTKVAKTGKVYTAHRLVASRMTDKGPRQHVVMSLPQLSLAREKWTELAQVLECRLAGQERSFSVSDQEVLIAADEAMQNYRFVQTRQKEFDERKNGADYKNIDINSLGHTKHRSLGPELIALAFWERLEFDKYFRECKLSPREILLAKAVILGRLIHPGSELDLWEWLTQHSSLPELIDDSLEGIGKDPIYRIADILFSHKEALEKSLYLRQRELKGRAATVFLYDLTNTYFEGVCAKNALAKHGVSKEKRADCRLVTMALVVDEAGLPVFSRIYGGSQSEPETLDEILQNVSPKENDNSLFAIRPTIIMDRGIATKENLKNICERGWPYAIIERRNRTKEFEEEFVRAAQSFISVKEDICGERVLIKKLLPEKSGPALLLCLSEARREKEKAIDALLQGRFDKEVEKIRTAISSTTRARISIERRVGRLMEKFPSIAKHYEIRTVVKEGVLQDLVCEEKTSGLHRSAVQGCYVIETSHLDMPAEEIWHLYMTLTRVEGAFRALKSDLGLRPVYHQLESRTKGHLFLSVLAYHILAAIESHLRDRGDHRRWSSLKKELASFQRATIVYSDSEDQLWHRRTSAIPEPKHKDIFNLLEIKDPLSAKIAIVAKRIR